MAITRTTFWSIVTFASAWTLLVVGAFRSEPLLRSLIGNTSHITHFWCGPWGCSAPLPAVLAWQLPVTLALLPVGWLCRKTTSAWLCSRLGQMILGGVVLYLGGVLGMSWQAGEITSLADAGRRTIFSSVAGSTIVLPLAIMAAGLMLAGWWEPVEPHNGQRLVCD